MSFQLYFHIVLATRFPVELHADADVLRGGDEASVVTDGSLDNAEIAGTEGFKHVKCALRSFAVGKMHVHFELPERIISFGRREYSAE